MDDILTTARASALAGSKQPATWEKAMKAIVVTEQAAGTAGMRLVKRPEPQAAINDVIVRVQDRKAHV